MTQTTSTAAPVGSIGAASTAGAASAAGVMATAEDTYNKLNLPSLPAGIKELLVTVAPWLALLGGALGLLVFVPGTALMLLFSPLAAVGGGGLGYVFTIMDLVLSIVGAVLSLMAFNGLRKRTMRGWTLMFWSSAIYLVAGLLPISIGGIIGTVIGGAIALYLLFQTKPYYDGAVASVAAPVSA